LAVSFLSLASSAKAPPISPDAIPVFDAAFVCRMTTGVRPLLPDGIDIGKHCLPIDPSAFRTLILSAIPEEDWGDLWKEGSVAIGRSQQYGDKYFLIRWFSPHFVRPGVEGSYKVPDELGDQWEHLLLEPLRPPQPAYQATETARLGPATTSWDPTATAPRCCFQAGMPELRNDPRFAPLCARLGLVEFWMATDKWPDCAAGDPERKRC
jgi:hypothetical protein